MREEHMNMLEALEIIDAAKGYRDWSPIFDPDIPVRERKERREGKGRRKSGKEGRMG